MNLLVDALNQKGCILKSLINIPLKSLGSKKRVECFLGVDLKSNYVCIIKRDSKVKLLSKEYEELNALVDKLQKLRDHNIFKRILFIDSEVCSKVANRAKNDSWRVWRAVV